MSMKPLPIVAVDPSGPRTRRFRPLRDLPALVWLVLVVVATLVHPWLPAPRWLLLHLLFLGAIGHSILVWSEHFALALLHARATDDDRRRQDVRLGLHNTGTAVVVAGVLTAWWPVTAVGAAAVAVAAGWHAAALVVRLRRALGTRFAVTVRYYVAAAAMLPVGALLGTVLARGLADPAHAHTVQAHALTNLLGWMGLTILGTLVTLWPTMLRTRMDDGALPASRRALPVLVVGVLVAATGAATGASWVLAAGLLGYLAGAAVLLVPLVRTARRTPPRSYAAGAVGLGMVWFVGCVVVLLAGTVRAGVDGDPALAARTFDDVAPFLAAGVAAPVLLGSLSYLLPASLSSGPAVARTLVATMDRGAWFRVVATNTALVVCALPVGSFVRVLASVLYLVATAAFLPLMVLTMREARRARAARAAGSDAADPAPGLEEPHRPDRPRQALAGLVAVTTVVALGVALDAGTVGGTAAASTASGAGAVAGAATGERKTVRVEMRDMRFVPEVVEVAPGTHLTIELVNADDADVHDLVLASGARSGRLAPGESTTLDVGVVTGPLDGWCSVVGHRAMGMALTVTTTGVPASAATHDAEHAGAPDVDLAAAPGDGFEARDATLPELPPPHPDGSPTVHRHTFEVVEREVEVAPGVTQTLWTFDGTAPGPTLHGRVGDVFEITLVNHGSMGHSIDFHASNLAPDEPMRTIAPGESLVYRFTAERAGVWMYHCGTMPMTAHIANGMAGAVVIEPDGLPDADRTYVVVQSELYLGPQGEPVDAERALAGGHEADLVTFNGYANQYVAQPLAASAGERVRVWVLDAGPNLASSFHVVGAQFDRVWSEGAYLLGSADAPADGRDGGTQALALQPAQGGFVEMVFPEAGTYPFVTHVMAHAERGAKGLFAVDDG